MLDLDTLAEKCAKSLNEQQDKWRAALWSADFQKIAQNMSDGEIEILLTSCKSVTKLEAVLRHLIGRGSASPFETLTTEAKAAGLALRDWINSIP